MHIITRKRLNEFAEKHPEAKSALQHCTSRQRQRISSHLQNYEKLLEALTTLAI